MRRRTRLGARRIPFQLPLRSCARNAYGAGDLRASNVAGEFVARFSKRIVHGELQVLPAQVHIFERQCSAVDRDIAADRLKILREAASE